MAPAIDRMLQVSFSIFFFPFSLPNHGGSGIICGSSEAAGGHCSRDWRIRASEEERTEFQRVVSISSGKDSFVQRERGEADVLLLRLWEGRRRFSIRDGNGEGAVPGGGAHGRGEVRD